MRKQHVIDGVKFLFGWPLSFLALFFIGKLILANFKHINTQLIHINIWYVLLSFLFFLLYFLTRGVLWQILLFHKGHKIPLWETSYLWSIAELRRFVPGNIWAFVGRAAFFKKKEVPHTTTAKLLAIESIVIVLSSAVNTSFVLPILSVFHISYLLEIVCSIGIFVVCCIFIFNRRVFSFSVNFKQLLVGSISMLFFGLGTAFSITAITSYNPLLLLPISGLSNIAYLAGYLSLITPMGLGIREAALVAGLSKFSSLEVAGLAAFSARIIVILAELVYLGIITLIALRQKHL